MNTDGSQGRRNGLAALAMLLIAVAELVMRESVHRVSAESFRCVLLLLMCPVLATLSMAASRARAARVSRVVPRLLFVVATVTSMAFVLQPTTGAAFDGHVPVDPWRTGTIFGLAVLGTGLACRVSNDVWRLVRKAALVSAIAFVGSQPALVALRAPSLSWPPLVDSSLAGEPPQRLTVFLLLDELNATASAPIVELLRAEGLAPRFKAIQTVGDGTAKVVPAMFTGKDFSNAKPCALDSLCSGDNVLDFSRVRASRPDIDVVGFFHPYCAMTGLRYCVRAAVRQSALDLDRWRCGAWRRTGFPETSPAQCDRVYRRDWSAMTDEVLHAIWQAPVWVQGGFLFAHVPLPHPPGRTPGKGLADGYAENLDRALALVRDIVRRARASKIEHFRLVVFSDHPLRQGQWCKNEWVYASRSCPILPSLIDTKVPLIVAGDDAPAIDDISRNDEVFELAFRR